MRSFLTGIISTFLVAAALAVAFWWSGGVAAVQRQVSVVASAATSSIAPLTITEVAALPQSESPSASQAETY